MIVTVDKDLCLGCGICEGIAPDIFSLADTSYAEVLLTPVPEELQAAAKEAAEECPEHAIVVDESDLDTAAIAEVESTEETLEEKKMKATVDKDLCTGCGLCEGTAPDVFSLANEPYAEVILNPIPEELWADVRMAAEDCPEGAITIEE